MLDLLHNKTTKSRVYSPLLHIDPISTTNFITKSGGRNKNEDRAIKGNENIFVNNYNTSITGEKKQNLPAIKQWPNSVYSYNKNNDKFFISTTSLTNQFIKSYFNLSLLKGDKKSSRVQIRFKRLSLNRILVSEPEVKHRNNKVTVGVCVYNSYKRVMLFKLNRLNRTILNKTVLNHSSSLSPEGKVKKASLKLKRGTKIKKTSLLNYHSKYITKPNEKDVSPLSDKNYNVKRKAKMFFYKWTDMNKKLKASNYVTNSDESSQVYSLVDTIKVYKKKTYYSQKKKIRLTTLKNSGFSRDISDTKSALKGISFKSYEEKMNDNSVSKLYKNQVIFLKTAQSFIVNNNKFKSWFSLGIKSIISRFYKKKVSLNLWSSKYLFLNNDILNQSFKTKLKNRKNRLLKVLKKGMILSKIPNIKDHLTGFMAKAGEVAVEVFTTQSNITQIENSTIETLPNKALNGVRLEAAGRLSRRLTASRSVYKHKISGRLKEAASWYKIVSSALSRGQDRPYLNKTGVQSNTRTGAFGLQLSTSMA